MIFAADLHLKNRTWVGRFQVGGDAYVSLDYLGDYAVKQKQPVILGGDTFDKLFIGPDDLSAVNKFMEKMNKAKLKVYFINGQHDKEVNGCSHLAELGAEDIDEQLVEIEGKKVYGLSYRPTNELKEALASVPECDYLVLHTSFKHLLGFEGAYQITHEDIPEYVKNVLVGDIHVKDVSKYGSTKIYSPGSGYVIKMDERKHQHGFFVFKGNRVTHKEYPLRTMVDLSVPEQGMEKVLEELKELDKVKGALPPVAFITVEGDHVDMAAFENVIGIQHKPRPDVPEEELAFEDPDAPVSLEAALGLVCKPGEPAKALLEKLLASKDPATDLNGWLVERGVALIEV